MPKRLDLSTKLAVAGLTLGLLVFLFGDNIAGRLAQPAVPGRHESVPVEESGPASPIQGAAASSLTILVDLPSGSTKQATSLRANLADLNKAVMVAVDALPKPVLLRYVRAGAIPDSGRAHCARIVDRSLRPRTGSISTRGHLSQYLDACSMFVANQAPVEELPLANAIQTASHAAPTRAHKRILVIVSGFNAPPPDGKARQPSPKPLRTILISVPGRSAPGGGELAAAVPLWREELERRGAEVASFDISVLDVPADLASEIVR